MVLFFLFFKMLQNEEATGHALTTWNGIALRWGSANHLEEVLSNAHVIFLVALLADHGMNDSLEDVFLGENAFHVFD